MWYLCRLRQTRCILVLNQMSTYLGTVKTPTLMKKVMKNNSSTVYNLSCHDIKLITGNCPSLQEKLDFLFLELYIRQIDGLEVPNVTSLQFIQKTLQCNDGNVNGLSNYFIKLCHKHPHVCNVKIVEGDDVLPFLSYADSNRLCWVSKNDMNQFYRYTPYQAMQFGQKLAIDFSRIKWLNQSQRMVLSEHIRKIIYRNGLNRRPFHLHFCSLLENVLMSPLESYLRNLFRNSAITVSASHYLDMFPRQEIVYLMPDAKEEFYYDSNAVYVICPFNDKKHMKHRIGSDNVKKCGLPLGAKWHDGGLWLSVDQIYSLILDSKNLGGA